MRIPVSRRARRAPLALALIALAMLFSQPQVGQGQTPQKPNILVIMLDDYDVTSIAMLMANGMMPNFMNFMMQTGTFFPDTFSVGGFGGPARASFLTGQYPQNHGVHGFQPDGGVEKLNANSTVATWLKAAGYRTGHFGRYVTGYGWWTSRTAIPPGWDDWRTLVDPSSLNTVNYTVNVNGTIVDVGAIAQQSGTELHQADVLAFAGSDFIRTAPQYGKPFFLVVAPAVFNLAVQPPFNACPGENTPQYDPFYEGSSWGAAQRPALRHLDTIWGDPRFALLRPPSFNEADVNDKPEWSWARRTGIMSDEIIDCVQKRNWRKFEGLRSVDDMIGWLMMALQDTGALANTTVIFTGDNGLIEGQHRVVGKGVPYDEANRVPLVIRPAGSTGPLRIVPKLVMSTDLAPTIAQMAQATPAHVPDGRSLVPLLTNANAPWRRIGLIESIGDWDPFAERPLPPTFFAVRTDSTRPRFYARYTTALDSVNTGEMYDLAVDPYQLQNRFYDAAKRGERDWLELWMGLLRGCRGATCQYLESNFFWTN